MISLNEITFEDSIKGHLSTHLLNVVFELLVCHFFIKIYVKNLH
jgi:uncharacterized membrane protein